MIWNNLLLFRKFARNSLNYFHQNTHSNLLKFIKSITQSYYKQIYLSIFIFLTMTCDSESVKSRIAHLLKSIASKQVFLISFDVSAKSQNVTISWNINISQQLCQWAINQSDEIIKMLIKLRDQWDMTLKLNEQWIDLQVDYIKRLDELKINQMTINTQEETIIELWEKVLSFKKRQRSADQSQSQQSTESRSTINHLSQQDIELHTSIKNHTWREMFNKFISFKNERHQFYKFSISFIFIEEDELT